jgi:transcriptional regulator with XRE-family HTH domain
VETKLNIVIRLARELAAKPGWSQAKVARHIGTNAGHLSNILSGKTEPHDSTLDRFEAKLYQALGGHPPEVIPGNFFIRRVSRVAATDFNSDFEVDLMNEEGVPGYLYPFPMHDPMVLRVSGKSMECDRAESISDGDDIIFANALEEYVPSGAIVVARHKIKDTQTVKVLQRLPNGNLLLVPNNKSPEFRPIEISPDFVELRIMKVHVRYPYKQGRSIG